MPSISYKLTAQLFNHTVKSIMDGTKQGFIDYVYSMAAKRGLEIPHASWRKKYNFQALELDEMTVIKLAPPDHNRTDGLIMYFSGDGLYQPPSAADFELCGDLVDNTGKAVWLVSYPLVPNAGAEEIVKSSYDVYLRALKEYAAENIIFMGLSSGCCVAMGICFYIKENGLETAFPSRMLLQSPPLSSPPTPGQFELMKEIEPRDVTVPAVYFQYLAAITNFKGYEYLVRPLKHDMSGFPPIDVFYGTAEMAYAFLDDLTEKCSRAGVSLTPHIGKDMMRCWCLLAKTPEAKNVKKEYYRILR